MSYIDYNKIAEEAARRYPIGTKYIPLTEFGIVKMDRRGKGAERSPQWVSKKMDAGGEMDGLDVGYGYIYVDGIWADVIDKNDNIITYNDNLNIEPNYEVY